MPRKAPEQCQRRDPGHRPVQEQAEAVAKKKPQGHEGEAGTLIDDDVSVRADEDDKAFDPMRQIGHGGKHLDRLDGQNAQRRLEQVQVEAHFGQHPDAEIYLSQPGLGEITGARVLSEFGDDPHRYASGKARRNYAGTSPITRASGKKKIVTARFVRNDRLIDALMIQAFAALRGSPGARAFYDQQRAKGRADRNGV